MTIVTIELVDVSTSLDLVEVFAWKEMDSFADVNTVNAFVIQSIVLMVSFAMEKNIGSMELAFPVYLLFVKLLIYVLNRFVPRDKRDVSQSLSQESANDVDILRTELAEQEEPDAMPPMEKFTVMDTLGLNQGIFVMVWIEIAMDMWTLTANSGAKPTKIVFNKIKILA